MTISEQLQKNIEEFCLRWDKQSYFGSKESTIEFLKSSQLALLQAVVEECEKMLVNTPEKVMELNKNLPSTLQEQSYSEAIGYTKAVNDITFHLTKIIKENK